MSEMVGTRIKVIITYSKERRQFRRGATSIGDMSPPDMALPMNDIREIS